MEVRLLSLPLAWPRVGASSRHSQTILWRCRCPRPRMMPITGTCTLVAALSPTHRALHNGSREADLPDSSVRPSGILPGPGTGQQRCDRGCEARLDGMSMG